MTERAIALDGVPVLPQPQVLPPPQVLSSPIVLPPPRIRYGYVGPDRFRWIQDDAGRPLRVFLNGTDVTADCVDFYDGDAVDNIGAGSYANLIIRSTQESGFRRVYGTIELRPA